MAVLALRRKHIACVTRICDLFVLRAVARETLLRGPRELTVDVTLLAVHSRMTARQREASLRIVLETSAGPIRRRVAGLAGSRETCLSVIRARGSVELTCVAAKALGRHPLKLSADVTLSAVDLRVRPCQCKIRELVVIKTGVVPLINAVARLALQRQSSGSMVETTCSRIVRLVASDALGA